MACCKHERIYSLLWACWLITAMEWALFLPWAASHLQLGPDKADSDSVAKVVGTIGSAVGFVALPALFLFFLARLCLLKRDGEVGVTATFLLCGSLPVALALTGEEVNWTGVLGYLPLFLPSIAAIMLGRRLKKRIAENVNIRNGV